MPESTKEIKDGTKLSQRIELGGSWTANRYAFVVIRKIMKDIKGYKLSEIDKKGYGLVMKVLNDLGFKSTRGNGEIKGGVIGPGLKRRAGRRGLSIREYLERMCENIPDDEVRKVEEMAEISADKFVKKRTEEKQMELGGNWLKNKYSFVIINELYKRKSTYTLMADVLNGLGFNARANATIEPHGISRGLAHRARGCDLSVGEYLERMCKDIPDTEVKQIAGIVSEFLSK